MAIGQGSIMLTDSNGHQKVLEDIVYVLESYDQILSLMKFRREHFADFKFTGSEEFILHPVRLFTHWTVSQ